MKIAEALILRANLKSELEMLKKRIELNVKIQEGDNPQENAYTLLDEYNTKIAELKKLICDINRTNAQTFAEDGISLSDLIAERDMYRDLVKVYKIIYEQAIVTGDRYSSREIRYVCTVEVEKIQKSINEYSAKYQILDMKIQNINWTKDIIE